VIVMYAFYNDLYAAITAVTKKMLEEFISDIGPLHQALTRSNNKNAKYMRQLATVGCSIDPILWLPDEVQDYLGCYICKRDGQWRLMASPYTYMMSYVFDERGNLKSSVMAKSKLLTDGVHLDPVLKQLGVFHNYTKGWRDDDMIGDQVTSS
jgi:hypothetical protein